MDRQTPNLVRHPSQRLSCLACLIIRLIIQTIRRDPHWIRPDRRGTQREQARSVWSRPDRRRAPGYGSGGQPGVLAGAAHWSPVPVGHGCRVVDDSAAGCPAWPLPRVSAVPGRAGSRCSAGRVRCPRIRTTVLRWLRRPGHLTSADEQIQHAGSCRRAATAAAGPRPSYRSRTLRPVSGWPRNRTPRPPWLSAAARRTAVGVHKVGVWTAGVRRRHCRSRWVSTATGSGRRPGVR